MAHPWSPGAILTATDLNAAFGPVRHRRSRAALAIATGTVNIFGASATGTTDEDTGGISFTANATNGFFTVATAATYALTLTFDPTAVFGATSTLNIVIASVTHQVPVTGGSTAAPLTIVKYIAAAGVVTFSVTNNSGGALTADVIVELTRVSL